MQNYWRIYWWFSLFEFDEHFMGISWKIHLKFALKCIDSSLKLPILYQIIALLNNWIDFDEKKIFVIQNWNFYACAIFIKLPIVTNAENVTWFEFFVETRLNNV